MASLELLELSVETFLGTLRQVADDQWHLPTPCDEWDVADLVTHVVASHAMGVSLLRGASRDEGIAVLMTTELEDDPAQQLKSVHTELVEALNEPDAQSRVCAHPAGDITGRYLVGFRMGDLTFHAWDLARAIGTDETLPTPLVEKLFRDLSPNATMLAETGMFGTGPSGRLPADASMQDQLLDLIGRRP